MRQRPPLVPLMPALPLAGLAATAAASIGTWRRLRRLERRLLPAQPDNRSPHEVLADHLQQARTGDMEADLAENFHPEVIVLSSFGQHRGHDGMRRLHRLLMEQAPNPTFDYHEFQVDGDVGFLRWSARTDGGGVRLLDGADSYVVRDGKIVAQTIHYRTESPQ